MKIVSRSDFFIITAILVGVSNVDIKKFVGLNFKRQWVWFVIVDAFVLRVGIILGIFYDIIGAFIHIISLIIY